MQLCIFCRLHCSMLHLLQLSSQFTSLLLQLATQQVILMAMELQLLKHHCRCNSLSPPKAQLPRSCHGLLSIMSGFTESAPQFYTRVLLPRELCSDGVSFLLELT